MALPNGDRPRRTKNDWRRWILASKSTPRSAPAVGGGPHEDFRSSRCPSDACNVVIAFVVEAGAVARTAQITQEQSVAGAALLAGLRVSQNIGSEAPGDCGPGKEEKEAKRCEHPAAAGAHVLYNAIRYCWKRGASDDAVGPRSRRGQGKAGRRPTRRDEWSEMDVFPEEFRHRASERGAKVRRRHVTSADDVLIDALKA